jgi:8-oxo-dGTP diphosphatase
MSNEIINIYGNKIRVRTCGICIENNKILLIKHRSITQNGFFYAPPGGGVNDGETAKNALEREFEEETGLQIQIGKLLFINDFIKPPLHGIELFFEVKILDGNLRIGSDPETQTQIIEDIAWYSFEELSSIQSNEKHSFLNQIKDFEGIRRLKRYLFRHTFSI